MIRRGWEAPLTPGPRVLADHRVCPQSFFLPPVPPSAAMSFDGKLPRCIEAEGEREANNKKRLITT